MARSAHCISVIVCLLAARQVVAQEVLSKLLSTDSLWSGVKKDEIHSHLQRMLQIGTGFDEPENFESCSPAALKHEKKCIISSGSTLSHKSSVAAPDCKGPDCLVAPMPGETSKKGAASSELHAPVQKLVTYGPMTHNAFERMAQRKRAALHSDLKKTGKLTPELEAFLSGPGGKLKDSFGIPLPAGPSEPLESPKKQKGPAADFEMRFEPQTPSSAPEPTAITTTSVPNSTKTSNPAADVEVRFSPQAPAPEFTTEVTNPTTAPDSSISAPNSGDFEMRFSPQTPAPDPNLIRHELEAFINASPAAAPTHGSLSSSLKEGRHANLIRAAGAITSAAAVAAEASCTDGPAESAPQLKECKLSPSSTSASPSSAAKGPGRPPMTEQEAARIATQRAANTTAREAAVERRRRSVWAEKNGSSASALASKKAAENSGGAVSASSTTRRQQQQLRQQQQQPQQEQQQRRRQAKEEIRATSTIPSSSCEPQVLRRISAAVPATHRPWAVLGYVLVAVMSVAGAVGLFVVAAVMEDALREHPGRCMTAVPAQWLALARFLWRRPRRAFAAARKTLTGHDSDLPMSVNEGAGPLVRAVAAASAFVYVFWLHLKDNRGQHIGDAFTAAIVASRRASTGGAAAFGISSCYLSSACYSPYAASQYQQHTAAAELSVLPQMEADASAVVTAAAELSLRRRH